MSTKVEELGVGTPQQQVNIVSRQLAAQFTTTADLLVIFRNQKTSPSSKSQSIVGCNNRIGGSHKKVSASASTP